VPRRVPSMPGPTIENPALAVAMPSPFQWSRPAIMKPSSEPARARNVGRVAACRGDDLSRRGHGRPQDRVLGLRIPQATKAYSERLNQECSVEDEARGTAEGYRSRADSYDVILQRFRPGLQTRHERHRVRSDCGRIAGRNGGGLAGTEVCRTVVVRLAALIGLVCRCRLSTVRLRGELTDVAEDDQGRREHQQPPGAESPESRRAH